MESQQSTQAPNDQIANLGKRITSTTMVTVAAVLTRTLV